MLGVASEAPHAELLGEYLYVCNGHTALAFEVRLPHDWRSRFLFYDELTDHERETIEKCIIEQGGSLHESGWYFADEDVKALAHQPHVQAWLTQQLANLESKL